MMESKRSSDKIYPNLELPKWMKEPVKVNEELDF